MIFTHLLSAIALAFIGIPDQLSFAITLLLFRACTQSMDVVPRIAFLSAVLLPRERTAMLGAINVLKIEAQSIGPIVAGWLVEKDLFRVAFLLARSLKARYDLQTYFSY
jgi:sugar phosphate permease